ncbi:hypothetical protein JVU11DRAFT_8709 [Chiua virens]|nr:hypothetical protein JVU11DRAFT_8709 [Chiua virens]
MSLISSSPPTMTIFDSKLSESRFFYAEHARYQHDTQKHPREIHSVPRKGVYTSYLAALQAGDKLRITVRNCLISLPNDLLTPVMCVGPGIASTQDQMVSLLGALREHHL